MVTYSEQQNALPPYYDPDTQDNIPTNVSSGIILSNDGIKRSYPFAPNDTIPSPFAQVGLQFTGNNYLSNSLSSLSRSINDFSVFNLYIHYQGNIPVNEAMARLGVNINTTLPATINVYGTLALAQTRFEIYNRNFRG